MKYLGVLAFPPPQSLRPEVVSPWGFLYQGFHIALPSGHVMTFWEMLRECVLDSAAIPRWAGALGYFSRALKVATLLATSVTTGVPGFILNSASSSSHQGEAWGEWEHGF